MIASCPNCRTRYRLDADRIRGGVRLRCRRCDTVFRVRPPADAPSPGDTRTGAGAEPSAAGGGPAPSHAGAGPGLAGSASAPPSGPPGGASGTDCAGTPKPEPARLPDDAPRVVVALRDPDLAKRVAEELASVGLAARVASNGREALLGLVREPPRALVVEDRLDLLDGRDLCEVVKRIPGLSQVAVVRVRSETAGPVWEVGPDAWIEVEDLPKGLPGLLDLGGPPTGGEPPAREPGAGGAAAAPASAPAGTEAGEDPARAEARRLARIAVSEFALYHPERFAAAAREGRLVEEFAAELEEGRAHLRGRLGAEVFRDGDPLVEELLRQGRERAGAPA